MRYLFVHQNFPGQFRHVAAALASLGHEVVALCIHAPIVVPGVKVFRYTLRSGNVKGQHPWLLDVDTKLVRAQSCAEAATKLKSQGFMPDMMVVHPGWGEPWFLRDIWPGVPMLGYFEFFYHPYNSDLDFDPEFPPTEAAIMQTRLRNAALWIGLDLCDAGISPTEWQKSTHPRPYQDKISVIFDGIDTRTFRVDPHAVFHVPKGEGRPADLAFAADDPDRPLISFVCRNLEPYRGWHIFARALPAILADNPLAHVAIVGGDEVSYSAKPSGPESYRARYWNEISGQLSDSERARVHFLGKIPHPQLSKLFQVATAHVYLTYPFVLSWSMLEAMAQGALVIGSRTAPVLEVIEHEKNGLIVDFFDSKEIAETVSRVIAMRKGDPSTYGAITAQARRTILERYDLVSRCLPAQLEAIESLMPRMHR